jgi:mannose-6-phosphate isomerase-like protein (cupin superfamily)
MAESGTQKKSLDTPDETREFEHGQISGRLKVVMDNRTEADLGPGDAYVIEPGHDGWVVGDEPYVAIDVSVETVEKFAKEEEDKGLIDRAKDKLSGQ